MSSLNRSRIPRKKNFVQQNIRAVSCSPSPAAGRPRATSTPLQPAPPLSQYLTPNYTPRVIRSNSSPEIKKINRKLEDLEKENEALKQKMKDNERGQQKKFEEMEKESAKMKKKFKEMKIQIKLLERLVTQTTMRTGEGPPPEMNQDHVSTSQAGPGTCRACGSWFKRLDQHKARTSKPDCKKP